MNEILLFDKPHELLGMADQDRPALERRIMQALEHVRETGLLHPADPKFAPIRASTPMFKLPIPGYEGGVFDPMTLGAACIVVPPSQRGPNTMADFNLKPDGNKTKTSEPRMVKERMTVNPHKGKEPGPELDGQYYKFTLDPAFLLSEPAPEAGAGPGTPAANTRLPFAVMHLRKPPHHTRVLVKEPTTPVDEPPPTPTYAPPATSETTSDESLEHVTGLVERLCRPEAVSGDRVETSGATAAKLNDQGKAAFRAQKYHDAIEYFTRSLNLKPHTLNLEP